MSMNLSDAYSEFHKLPKLKDLSIQIQIDIFKSLEPQFPWKCALTREELETVMQTFHLDELSGLVKLKMTSGTCMYAKTPAQEQ